MFCSNCRSALSPWDNKVWHDREWADQGSETGKWFFFQFCTDPGMHLKRFILISVHWWHKKDTQEAPGCVHPVSLIWPQLCLNLPTSPSHSHGNSRPFDEWREKDVAGLPETILHLPHQLGFICRDFPSAKHSPKAKKGNDILPQMSWHDDQKTEYMTGCIVQRLWKLKASKNMVHVLWIGFIS